MSFGESILDVVVRAFVVVNGLLTLVTIAEFFLGLLVLQRGGGRAAARFLGAYLMLQFFSLGLLFLDARISTPTYAFGGWVRELGLGDAQSPFLLGAIAFSFLPPLLLGFALTYPTPVSAVAGRPWLLALPFLPSLYITVLALQGAGAAWGTPDGAGLDGVLRSAATLDYAYEFVAAILAAVVFWRRRRHAATDLERRRLGYMLRALALPLAVAIVPVLVFVLIGKIEFEASLGVQVLFVLILLLMPASLVLIPALGMSYGLLRFRILDLEQRVRSGFRFTLSRSLIAGVFVAVFFAASETTAAVVGSRTHYLVGILAASLLVFFLVPLQHLADRVAQRAVPPNAPSDKYREFRRWEVYRATYEDLIRDQRLTARERRTLEALARNLGLTSEEIGAIEGEVRRELGTPVPRTTRPV